MGTEAWVFSKYFEQAALVRKNSIHERFSYIPFDFGLNEKPYVNGDTAAASDVAY